jgi:transglutaminase-like putative cysteine protease
VTGKTTSIWTVAALVALGITSIVIRQNLDLEASDSDYLLTYSVDFHVRRPDGRVASVTDARLFASIPETTRYCKVLRPQIEAPEMEPVHYRIHTADSRKNVVLRTSKTGPVSCTVAFRLHLDDNGDWRQTMTQPPLTANERAKYLANDKGMTATSSTALEMLNRLRDNRPGNQELVHRIFEACRKNIEPSGELGDDSGDNTLLHQKGSPLGQARAMVTLCRAAKIPARLATGFEIKKADDVQPRSWVEVYAADRWEPYDLENGFERELPHNVVPVRHDGIAPVRVTNSTDLVPKYSISGAPPTVRTPISIFDLHQLPVKLQEPIKVVLILPIGALLTSLMRTIIGIRTFGTFSPTLLALAFVYNDFWSGLCIFAVVVATGFISRGVLDRLRLLLVPRLSIILTLVVMLMVLGIAIMNYFKELAPSGQTVLLPMVILTNLVERFYVTSEEDNFLEAVRLMVTTMLLALAIYLLLNWRVLGNMLFDYPELHLFTVAILVLMGRYTGYRLTELVRFRDLVQPPKE